MPQSGHKDQRLNQHRHSQLLPAPGAPFLCFSQKFLAEFCRVSQGSSTCKPQRGTLRWWRCWEGTGLGASLCLTLLLPTVQVSPGKNASSGGEQPGAEAHAPGLPAGEAGDGPCAAVVQCCSCNILLGPQPGYPSTTAKFSQKGKTLPCPARSTGPLVCTGQFSTPREQRPLSLDVCQSRALGTWHEKYDCLINGEWWGV